MPDLVPPDARFHHSFLASVDEILAAGEGDAVAGLWIIPRVGDVEEQAVTRAELADAEVFAGFADRLRSLADPDSPIPEGIVHVTHLWFADGDAYLGRLSIRHTLTPWLRELGGHIGYVVRPSARRRGHATSMLRASLPWARRLGIENALVTCDDNNVASRKVIEACGGVFDDQRHEKLRYWVPTT